MTPCIESSVQIVSTYFSHISTETVKSSHDGFLRQKLKSEMYAEEQIPGYLAFSQPELG